MRKAVFAAVLLGLGWLLAGCGGMGLPGTSLGPNPTLKGKVQDYVGPKGELVATDMYMEYVFGRGEIRADGSFELKLFDLANMDPALPLQQMESFSTDSCSLEVSTGEVRWEMLGHILVKGQGIRLYYANPELKNKNAYAVLFYADRDARVKTTKCPFTWDLDLKRGWNWMMVYEKEDSLPDWKTEVPTGFKWVARF